MSFTTEQPECPICFDQIGEKNNITTECGHKFHASCLMKNITRNGFGCPCCRATMAEHPEDDYDEHHTESEYSDEEDDDETATLLDVHVAEPFSDDALRGLRLLTNLLEDNLHDPADEAAENQYVEEVAEQHEDPPSLAPPREYIVRTLTEQGITYEHLVAWVLLEHDEYENQTDELERFSTDIWGKLRIMINNYKPEQNYVPEQNGYQTPVIQSNIEEVVSPISIFEDLYIDFDKDINSPPQYNYDDYDLVYTNE